MRHRRAALVAGTALLVVGLGEPPVPAGASSLSLLPLNTGNRWEYVVGPRDRWPTANDSASALIEVLAPVRIVAPGADTTYMRGDRSALGAQGDLYYEVRLTGRTYLFPWVEPQALFVREDGAGDLWCRGHIIDGKVRLTSNEQPWLLRDQTEWDAKLDGLYLSTRFAREAVSVTGDHDIVAYIQALTPGAELVFPDALVNVIGEMSGTTVVSGAAMGAYLVAGLGPVAMTIQSSDGGLYRSWLVRALVGDRAYLVGDPTAAMGMTWGQAKEAGRRPPQGGSY